MKVEQKEPIQSLIAFGRHINRGSNAALPLLSLRSIRFFLLPAIMGLVTLTATAQQKDADRQTTDSNEKRIDLLFDQIMNTLPAGDRMKVDSASAMKTNRQDPAINPPSISSDHAARLRATRVDELPPELKAQVERTINSMELRKEERKMQFRETAKERH